MWCVPLNTDNNHEGKVVKDEIHRYDVGQTQQSEHVGGNPGNTLARALVERHVTVTGPNMN